jgi:hypothetical protein
MKLFDRILETLGQAKDGRTTRDLTAAVDMPCTSEGAAVVEAFLLMCRRCRLDGERWRTSGTTKMARVVAEIENYAQVTGKHIFRVSSALASVPVDEQPTQEQLESALIACNSPFRLLPNAMIKKVGS